MKSPRPRVFDSTIGRTIVKNGLLFSAVTAANFVLSERKERGESERAHKLGLKPREFKQPRMFKRKERWFMFFFLSRKIVTNQDK